MKYHKLFAGSLILLLAFSLISLTGCATGKSQQLLSENGELLAAAKGKVLSIKRRDAWFEMKPRSGGRLQIAYDQDTNLVDFKDMMEIKKDQPVEVIYMPLGEQPFRALSIRKLNPAECG